MPLSSEEIQQLREGLAKGEATPWKWDEDGLEILGNVQRLEKLQTKDFGEALALIIEVDGVERRVLLTTVLRQKLQRLNGRSGEAVGIERGAEKVRPASGGAPYWDYRIARIGVDNAPALDWGTSEALPAAESVVDAEVVDNEYAYDAPYEVPHLPRQQGGF